MKSNSIVQWMATGLSVTGLCLPMQTLAAADSPSGRQTAAVSPEVRTIDVVAVSGKLAGRVVDSNGKAVPGAKVVVLASGKHLHETITNADGAFTVSNVRNGIYHINAANAAGIYRVWGERNAPPAAMEQAVLVTVDDNAVRGQGGFGGGGMAIGGLAMVGVVAAAGVITAVEATNSKPPVSP